MRGYANKMFSNHMNNQTQQKPNKRNLVVAMTLACFLTACSSAYKPKKTQMITYHAPAQAYSLDLSAQSFRGAVKVKDSCTIGGTSTDFTDSEGQFFRIDTINLINNPNVELPEFADDATVQELVFIYYTDMVNKGGTLIEQKPINTTLGPALFGVVHFANNKQYVGYMIVRRGNLAYVYQHIQTVYQENKLKDVLAILAAKTTIPGRLPKNKKQSETPIYIDMKNATAKEIENWKALAQCGK